jgi:SGNH domain (fused to AT3 domains)
MNALINLICLQTKIGYVRLGVKPKPDDTKPEMMVFGDSHSKSLFDAFNEAALQANIHAVYSGTSYCTPLLGIYILRADQAQVGCHLVNQRVFDYVKANQIKKVFLIGRWSVYTDGGYDGLEATWIGLTKDGKKQKASSRIAFEAALKKTVAAYARIGVQLSIVEQVPQQTLDVKELYYKIYANDLQNVSESIRALSVSRQQHVQLQSFVSALFKKHAQAGQLNLVNFDDIFCGDDKCLIGTDKYSYYFDNNHLTTAGGLWLLISLRNISVISS